MTADRHNKSSIIYELFSITTFLFLIKNVQTKQYDNEIIN